ncbi:protocatechuate 3,4-dioxygenase subunit beta [Yoonia sp. SS1-5]|uniref:Protocatechuate 3,4-dioxygenase subunit beta n=1 Tax=Yoonia rhodophyticola TaxID=3137370 RepID=A0AAN0NLF4_9RHOB
MARDRDWQPAALTPDYKTTILRSPHAPLLHMPTALPEETGPVFGHDVLQPRDDDLILNYGAEGQAAIGPRILVHGVVADQNGRPLPDTLIEIWQANAAGRYRHHNDGYLAPLDPHFGGCGRVMTDTHGAYTFRTIQPGAYPWPNGPNAWRPAHIHLSILGPSFAQRLITQFYFEGDPLIPLCPIVNSLGNPAAVDRLTARLDMDRAVPMDMLAYRFDITLRGRHQTPFENRTAGL